MRSTRGGWCWPSGPTSCSPQHFAGFSGGARRKWRMPSVRQIWSSSKSRLRWGMLRTLIARSRSPTMGSSTTSRSPRRRRKGRSSNINPPHHHDQRDQSSLITITNNHPAQLIPLDWVEPIDNHIDNSKLISVNSFQLPNLYPNYSYSCSFTSSFQIHFQLRQIRQNHFKIGIDLEFQMKIKKRKTNNNNMAYLTNW